MQRTCIDECIEIIIGKFEIESDYLNMDAVQNKLTDYLSSK